MISVRSQLLTLIVLATPVGPATAATGSSRFDGNWTVQAFADTGSCAGPYQFPIVIEKGTFSEAGKPGSDVSGQAGADGKISGTIRQGLGSVAVSGTLEGSSGSGRWALSGLGACAGHWTARRAS